MTSIADLVQTLQDIDAYRGKTCGACMYGNAGIYQQGYGCRMGHAPAGRDDGCSDWRSQDWKTHQRPPHGPGEAA
jgi:hypothetical protein